MTSKAGDQPHESSHHVPDGDLLAKLNLTFPEQNESGSCKLRPRYCGLLLAFHLMNAAVAAVGFIAVVAMLAGISLNLGWFAILLVVAVGAVPFLLLSVLPERLSCLTMVGNGVVMAGYLALYVYSFFNIYTVLTPYVMVFGGAVGLLLFYPSYFMAKYLVKTSKFCQRHSSLHFDD